MLRTAIGVLAIDSVVAIEPEDISGEEARRAGYVSRGVPLADLRNGDGRFYRIEFHPAGPDPREILRQDDHLGVEELSELRDRLAALDQKSRAGPWTVKALRMLPSKTGEPLARLPTISGLKSQR
ncbi:YeaH/YhbH family protein [Microvirga brassicacearum]|uniref:YeaH/YhbH family protein n=1 Tax=Microvirga brassicacearum TaxID=2580413 RepID=A0A5N3P734_9HYPH|nr:YeaH/YhbH family protein [Microvirga brassicacearum]KAB0265481.1 YeaH/YhbH family protein [Microvirga brassicacearum]